MGTERRGEARGRLRALLLDYDGTLVDSQALMARCFAETLARETGAPPDPRCWRDGVGLPLGDLVRDAFARRGAPAPSSGEVEALVEGYRRRLAELDGGLALFPGVRETLERLREAGVLLALVTTKHSSAVARQLPRFGLEPYFAAVVTGDRCARCKPDPEPFARAAALLGVDPGEAAGVGDSRHDIASARGAGLRAAAACWGAENREALVAAAPDRLLERPADLLALAGLPEAGA